MNDKSDKNTQNVGLGGQSNQETTETLRTALEEEKRANGHLKILLELRQRELDACVQKVDRLAGRVEELEAANVTASAELRHAWRGSIPSHPLRSFSENWRDTDSNLVSKAIQILERAALQSPTGVPNFPTGKETPPSAGNVPSGKKETK